MDKRPYHHGDLRAALLVEAERSLRAGRPEGPSLRQLARTLGVSPAAPSRHFPTKQALLDALALTGMERLTEAVATARSGVGPSFTEQLDAVARAYVAFSLANAALLELTFSVKRSPDASPALRTAARGWKDQGLELVRTGQRRGEVRAGPVEGIALTLFASLHGYAALAVSGVPLPGTEDRGLTEVVAALLRGCRPDPAPTDGT